MNEDRRPAFTVEGWACAYCASSMSAASQMCLTCGMPRPQGDEKAALRVATPSPKLMAVQKPYDPYEQFYVAAPEASGVIPQEPEFDAPSFGVPSFAANTAPAEKVSEPSISANLRASAMVAAIVVFAFALIFCLAIAWNSRGMIGANLEEVRIRLHHMSDSKPIPLPQYTATPISKADRARWASAAPHAPTSVAEITVVPAPPVPKPSGPGTMQVRISGSPAASNVIPVSLQ
jgi:hypothetical protein